MLFHATITHFKKNVQSQIPICCRIFKRRERPTDPVAPSSGIRSYRAERPLSSKSHSPALKDHNGEGVLVKSNVDSRNEDIKTSAPPDRRLYKNQGFWHQKPIGTTAFSQPSSKWELYAEILRLLSLSPPAPLSRLISLHQRCPTFQSVESYNVLLNFSIRHSFSRHTRSLLTSMSSNEIGPDTTTEKLLIRYMVMRGNWKEAWQQVAKRYSSVAEVPLAVLLELLVPGTRKFPRSRLRRSRRISHSGVGPRTPQRFRRLLQPLERVEDSAPPVKMPLDTLIIILHRFPQLPIDELARLPPRVISYAVRGLIRHAHSEPALALTEKHIKALPTVIKPRQIDFARDLIHLHLSSGEIKLAIHKKRRRLVEHLLALHPSLHPNARTVFLLMRYLGRSKRCGIEAYLFFKDYKARWGAAVESLEVRRRIVAFALKQRKYGIAKEIALGIPPGDSPSSHKPPASGVAPTTLSRIRPWRVMYPRKGRNARLWKRLLIRLLGRRRAWERRLYKWPWPT